MMGKGGSLPSLPFIFEVLGGFKLLPRPALCVFSLKNIIRPFVERSHLFAWFIMRKNLIRGVKLPEKLFEETRVCVWVTNVLAEVGCLKELGFVRLCDNDP